MHRTDQQSWSMAERTNENDAGSSSSSLLEQAPQLGFRLPAHATDDLRGGYAQEGTARLGSNRVGESSFAAAGGAMQQHSSRGGHSQPCIHLPCRSSGFRLEMQRCEEGCVSINQRLGRSISA